MYKSYLKMHIKCATNYRLSSILLGIAQLIVTASEVLGMWLLFSNFKAVGVWNFWASVLMFGIVMTALSFNETFSRGYDEFPELIKNGELDRFLVRPQNIYFQIFCYKVEWLKIGRLLFSVIISIVAVSKLAITWTLLKVLVLISAFICGIVVILGLEFVCSGISIFTIENLEFLNILTSGVKEIGSYPLDIYKKWLRNIFTFIIPLACFNYLPLSYILGVGNLPLWLTALSPLFGLLFFIPCFFFFRFALTKYQGIGT